MPITSLGRDSPKIADRESSPPERVYSTRFRKRASLPGMSLNRVTSFILMTTGFQVLLLAETSHRSNRSLSSGLFTRHPHLLRSAHPALHSYRNYRFHTDRRLPSRRLLSLLSRSSRSGSKFDWNMLRTTEGSKGLNASYETPVSVLAPRHFKPPYSQPANNGEAEFKYRGAHAIISRTIACRPFGRRGALKFAGDTDGLTFSECDQPACR